MGNSLIVRVRLDQLKRKRPRLLSRGTFVEQPLPRSLLKNILAASSSRGNGSNGLLPETLYQPTYLYRKTTTLGRQPSSNKLLLQSVPRHRTIRNLSMSVMAIFRQRPVADDPLGTTFDLLRSPTVNWPAFSQLVNCRRLVRTIRCCTREGASTVAEHGREHDNHQRRPYGVHGQIGDLPTFQGGKRAPVTQEARIEPRRPRQVDKKNEILAKSRHSVRSEAKLGDAGGNRRQRHPIHHECADQSSSCRPSKKPGAACGSRAEAA